MLNTIKLYHWKTKSYAQHKATDDLYAKLNENVDTFIEILLGKDGSRIRLEKNAENILDRSENLEEFKKKIYHYREFLIDLSDKFSPRRDTDLLNTRDEMLGNINQFLYLLTFE
jgi:DNA-binding ferritin-like protein